MRNLTPTHGTAAVSQAHNRMPDQMQDGCQPALAWGVVGERGKERRRQTHGVDAHFIHVILYTSNASIEASLDYYTNKNVVLRPARTTDREGTHRLCWTHIGLHHSMHVHFRKPVNAFDPDEAECRLQF